MNLDATWSGKARAKVNLRLQVREREESGYHRLDTIFQALELADDVTLGWTEQADVSIEVTGVEAGALGPPSENLAVRAARRFREAASEVGRPVPGIRIGLHKAIPHGAGLGGGSSDAGAVLRGLAELAGGGFDPDQMMRLGAEIGSDVPFFVENMARARGTGRGDRITALDVLPRRPVLLLLPNEPVPTAWAYATLAAARAREGPAARHFETPAMIADDWATTILSARNDFEDVLFGVRPELGDIRDALKGAGAELAMLSGSGSAVFGIFRTEDELTEAADALHAVRSPAWDRTIRTATVE